MSDENLEKVSDDLRRQLIDHVNSLAKSEVSPTMADLDWIIKLRNAIDALELAIDEGWADEPAHVPNERR